MKLSAVLLLFITSGPSLQAYDEYDSCNAPYDYHGEIGTNLNLNAVASLFGESENLSDFERRLNDPYARISNLDLDHNGYVDYLRLLEVARNGIHLFLIQSVLGPNLYRDIATIEVGRDYYNHGYVQIVGDPYLYGDHYIIEPSYIYTPMIYSYLWGPDHYRPYSSHYRWGYYPRRYHPWRPLPALHYRRNIHRHINHRNHYRYTHLQKKRGRKTGQTFTRDGYTPVHPKRRTAIHRPNYKSTHHTRMYHSQLKDFHSRRRSYHRKGEKHTAWMTSAQNIQHHTERHSRKINRTIGR